LSVFTNAYNTGTSTVFVDGTQFGSNTGGSIPLGINNAFNDAASLNQSTSQTFVGALVLSGQTTHNGTHVTSAAEVHGVTTTSATTYNVSATDRYVLVTPGAAVVVNLPVAPVNGRIVTVKDASGASATNNITVKGSQNIDGTVGSTGIVLNLNYASVDLIFNSSGNRWNVV